MLHMPHYSWPHLEGVVAVCLKALNGSLAARQLQPQLHLVLRHAKPAAGRRLTVNNRSAIAVTSTISSSEPRVDPSTLSAQCLEQQRVPPTNGPLWHVQPAAGHARCSPCLFVRA